MHRLNTRLDVASRFMMEISQTFLLVSMVMNMQAKPIQEYGSTRLTPVQIAI